MGAVMCGGSLDHVGDEMDQHPAVVAFPENCQIVVPVAFRFPVIDGELVRSHPALDG